MKRNKAMKCLLVGLLSCLTIGLVSCGSKQSSSTPTYQAFLMGVQEEMRMGDSILIKDLIGEMEKGTYTMTATCGSENVDLSGKITWTPSALGEWLITYTILEGENQGTYTHTINVVSLPYIVVSHMQEAMPFLYEQEISFAEFFDAQNIAVTSHNDGMWEPIMVSVRVDGKIIEFDETQTSYKLQSLSDHCFIYKIRTVDGRERKLMATVQVKYSFDETDLWLDANSNGQYRMDVANAESVKINDKQCSAEDVEITGTGVVFSEKALRDSYSGVNNVSVFTQSGEEKRYVLNVYADAMDMENGCPDDIFFFKNFSDNAAMQLTEFNGSTAMCLWGDNKYQSFYISREYLDFVFSNPDIKRFIFDFTVDFTATTGATSILLYNEATQTYTICNVGETVVIEIDRTAYEKYENEWGAWFQFMNQANNTGTVKLTWYIDNMRARPLYFDGSFETMTTDDLKGLVHVAYGQGSKYDMGIVEDPLGENGKVAKFERKLGHSSAPIFNLKLTKDVLENVKAGNILSMQVYGERPQGSDAITLVVTAPATATANTGSEIGKQSLNVGSEEWTTVEFTLTEAQAANILASGCIQFQLNGNSTSESVYYIDDFKIEKVEFDSTFESWTTERLTGSVYVAYGQNGKYAMSIVEDPLGENGEVIKFERKLGHSSAPIFNLKLTADILESVKAGSVLSMQVYGERPQGSDTIALVIVAPSTATANNGIEFGRPTLVSGSATASAGWTTVEFTLTEAQAANILASGCIQFQLNGNSTSESVYYIDDLCVQSVEE